MHDVFISYKSEDAHLAILVRHTLESNGIPCWMAERDIGPGSNYAADIPNAIKNCQVFILLLTENAQKSPWIPKELDSAISYRKSILPLVIGSFDINPTLTFLLTGIQHHDATENLTKTVTLLLPKIKEDISSGKYSGIPRKKSRHFFLRKCKRILHDILFWLITSIIVIFVLQKLDIDLLTCLPPEIRQTVLSLFDEHLRPVWDNFLAFIKNL